MNTCSKCKKLINKIFYYFSPPELPLCKKCYKKVRKGMKKAINKNLKNIFKPKNKIINFIKYFIIYRIKHFIKGTCWYCSGGGKWYGLAPHIHNNTRIIGDISFDPRSKFPKSFIPDSKNENEKTGVYYCEKCMGTGIRIPNKIRDILNKKGIIFINTNSKKAIKNIIKSMDDLDINNEEIKKFINKE